MIIEKGTDIDGYRLEEKIGSGGFGEVWRVTSSGGQTWAMKIYAAQSAGLDEYTRNAFREEYEKTSSLDHQNVVRSVAYGEHLGRPYLIMPLGKGSLLEVLRQRLSTHKQSGGDLATNVAMFSEEEIARILADVADGLAYLQDKGVLHQDIKPANILLMDVNGLQRYVIADFGVSTSLRSNVLRQTEMMQRTESSFAPAYASPEQLNGQVGKKSDIFSLGVMLYELSCGALPFQHTGMTPGQAINEGYNMSPLPDVFTQRFKRLIAICLSKDPKHRPSPMQLLIWADSFVKGDWWSEAITQWRVQWWQDKRLWIGGSVGVVLLLIAGLYWFWSGRTISFSELKQQYQVVRPFVNDRAAVQNAGGMWGFVDRKGKIVVPLQYNAATDFSGNFAAVHKGCCCGYINKGGTLVKSPEFKICDLPKNGKATVTDINGALKTIDLQ